MSFDIDDPRLTAFALGELEGAERDEIQQLIAADPSATRAVEEIRAAGRALEAEFASENGPGLTAAQRETITADLPQPATSGVVSFLRIAAVAAGLLVLVGIGTLAVLDQFDHSFGLDLIDDGFGPVEKTRLATNETTRVGPKSGGTDRYLKDFEMTIAQGATVVGPDGAVTSEDSARPMDRMKLFPLGAPSAEGEKQGGYFGDQLRRSAPGDVASPRLGFFFNDAEDGDIRARRENIYDNGTPVADPKGAPVPYHGPGGSVPPNMQPPGSPTPPPPPNAKAVIVAGVPVFHLNTAEAADKERRERDQLRGRYRHDRGAPNTEAYDRIVENPFLDPRVKPRSTLGVDVDTASYANARRFLNHNMLPPRGAVKIEEFVNYFSYNYAEPIDEHPFSTHVEVAGCPWRSENRLVRIGLKGRTIPRDQRPATNLVFLLDVSGSMSPANKLPLVKQSMVELVGQLDERDRVAIVTYSGNSGLALGSTPCNEKSAILGAIGRLGAGGSTNGGAGIEMAYRLAVENFIEGGANRVILCTDGDFNVGVTSRAQLTELIQKRAKTGVFLSVLGFGMGNLKNATLEELANKGNGHYAYIDDLREARKVLVEGLSGTLITIAKDVKLQVEFNPAKVAAYRLLGYENRRLAARDFKDDTKDAGEIGAGHTVTALYEVVPAGGRVPGPDVDPLKYQKADTKLAPAARSNDLLTVKLRYKLPASDSSTPLEVPVVDHGATYPQASRDFKFAASVAAFALLLRGSEFRGSAGFDMVLELGAEGKGPDPKGRRAEFLQLVEKAKTLCK